jgi:DNA-binding response OmpR family regulator
MASKRILVVDESAIACLATAEALNVQGIAATHASPALFAASGALQFKPDLVIVGVSLPDEDGFPLVAQVAGRLAGVPIVVFAMEPRTLRFAEWAALGVVALLPKSLLPSDLRRSVCALLGLADGRR